MKYSSIEIFWNSKVITPIGLYGKVYLEEKTETIWYYALCKNQFLDPWNPNKKLHYMCRTTRPAMVLLKPNLKGINNECFSPDAFIACFHPDERVLQRCLETASPFQPFQYRTGDVEIIQNDVVGYEIPDIELIPF